MLQHFKQHLQDIAFVVLVTLSPIAMIAYFPLTTLAIVTVAAFVAAPIYRSLR